MSSYSPALSFTLDWEDPKRLYSVVPDAGGYSVAGINSAAFPKDFAAISSAPQTQRSQMVYDFYLKEFWNPLKVGGILSQALANRVFDEGVNASSYTSIHLLQRAVVSLGQILKEDGVLGPTTIEIVNELDPEKLLAAFKDQRLKYYRSIVDNNPSDSKYLEGWEKRALG
jgi:type VI secretion system secreted protein VgrG